MSLFRGAEFCESSPKNGCSSATRPSPGGPPQSRHTLLHIFICYSMLSRTTVLSLSHVDYYGLPVQTKVKTALCCALFCIVCLIITTLPIRTYYRDSFMGGPPRRLGCWFSFSSHSDLSTFSSRQLKHELLPFWEIPNLSCPGLHIRRLRYVCFS